MGVGVCMCVEGRGTEGAGGTGANCGRKGVYKRFVCVCGGGEGGGERLGGGGDYGPQGCQGLRGGMAAWG